MIFYLLIITLIISFVIVTYFIIKSTKSNSMKNDNDNDINLIQYEWTDENKLFLKDFILKNEPNKSISNCIFDKIISLYSYKDFDTFYQEIIKYKENPDPSISLSKNTQLFMSNLIDIENTCAKN